MVSTITKDCNIDRLPGELLPLANGFLFSRDGRRYRLLNNSPDSHVFEVEAHVDGRSHWHAYDIRIADCRQDYAREISRGDAELEREVRRDLNLLRLKIQFARVDLWLSDVGNERDDCSVDLYLSNLTPSAAKYIASIAHKAGARVQRRRHA